MDRKDSKRVKVKPLNTRSQVEYDVFLNPAPPDAQIAYETLLTADAINFIVDLFLTFDFKVEQLHTQRILTKSKLKLSKELPDFIQSRERGNAKWKVAPVPNRLKNRHLDLGDVSPANTVHFVTALNADVQGIQVDFDDGHCPTWKNQLIGIYNVYRAVNGMLYGAPSIEHAPVLMLRPRAWNMTEHNMMINGKKIPGPLFDFGLLLYHVGKKLTVVGAGPFFYLSKIENAKEAQLWDEIFTWAEMKTNIHNGTIKACVLIENILASFQLEEILFALKDHSLGLNCGIWDYSASVISIFGERQKFVLPDRNKYVNMERLFLRSYLQLVVNTCHRRSAYATGGMAALLLPKEGDQSQEGMEVVNKVCAAKSQEIHDGVDGFMVYDVRLVSHINKLWKDNPKRNLKEMSSRFPSTADLLTMPKGGVTLAGLKHNIGVGILFVYNWLVGFGHFTYKGAIEDSATAEISRSQVWQWIRHQTHMEDIDGKVNRNLVQKIADEFVQEWMLNNQMVQRRSLMTAVNIFMDIVTQREFPNFITTYLNDSLVFWSFHAPNCQGLHCNL